ncbi:AAA family ATPase [Sorangium sp. So ce363]|uniref:AAA family ATPase n=1 Tax=Sorangium sp. So ce363 TaxID=3133304 RepID=UPI003F60048D
MDSKQFVNAGIQLASALAELHERNIIHQNVRPQNIVGGSEGGAVKLREPTFGARAKGLRSRSDDLSVSAEMFPYMAPEQTGRMNRPIDHRADLYSIGVTFYEMLSGELPLVATDALEWVHCHVARAPRPLTEAAPDVPPVIAAIVMKLLAKEADDRYQSARGLALDLEHCLAELEAKATVEPFPLGAKDVWDELRFPAKLYGREADCARLLAAFERVVADGVAELALVSGYSGIGKSSLVHEVHRPIVRERGFFLEGKFDQYKRDVPYFTISQAFRELTRQILSANEAQLGAWKRQLLDALGANAKLIIDIIPQMELLIGKQPDVAPLPSTEAQNRFHAVFRSFIGVFAQREHPLALFLDDLQWADFASLKLLEHIITHPETRHLLVIGAYRDNEVSPSHALTTTVGAIRSAKARVTEFSLGSLSLASLTELVADTFRCSPARAAELAELLDRKTAGNPFFATQFLGELYREGLIGFRGAEVGWIWDVDAISAKNYTDNVVELLVSKLLRLPEQTQASMKLAACIGNELSDDVLAMICGKALEETRADLEPAVSEGFLLSRRDGYKFLHDRVQQAAYALIPEETRGEVHLKIGRLLLKRTKKEEELAEKIFDIVNQINLGASLVGGVEEKTRFAELNLTAGKRAKASSAYRSAVNYLSAAAELLSEESWDTHYALTCELHTELAECLFLSGNLDDAERECANVDRARTKLDKAAFYRLRMQLCLARGENDKGIALCVECVGLFGVELRTKPEKEVVLAELQKVRDLVKGRRIEELLDLPVMTDPEMAATMSTLAWIYPSAFYVDPSFTDLVVGTMVRLSVLHGNAPASTMGYASFGAALCAKFAAYQEGYEFGKLACDLTERHGFIAFKPEVFQTHACLICIWTQHVRMQVEYAHIGFVTGRELGNSTYACFNLLQYVIGMLVRGDSLESVHAAAVSSADFIINAKMTFVADVMTSVQRLTLAMRGLTDRLGTFGGGDFVEADYEKHLATENIPLIHFFYQVNKLQARFIAGEYEEAEAAGEAAKGLLWTATAESILVHEYYYYGALCAAALYKHATAEKQKELRELLAASEARLRVWAESCPANFLGTHALVAAEIARIEGRDGDAAKLYDKSIRAFREGGFVQNEGVSSELAARFYIDREFDVLPSMYLAGAEACFTRWGAQGKVLQLGRMYAPHFAHKGTPISPAAHGSADTSSEQLDTLAAVKVSQALSSEMGPDKLLATLMRIVIEHAGAQKACLFTPEGEGFALVAEARIDHRETNVRVVGRDENASVSVSDFPASVLNYVKRSREKVTLDDAAKHSAFSSDEYIVRARPRSLLCMPIFRRGALAGLLYLENRLAAGVFTPRRLVLLEFMASVSIENATLHAEFAQENADRKLAQATLRQSEDRLRRLVETASVIPWEADRTTARFTYVGPQVVKMFGYPQDTWYDAGFLGEHVHPADRERVLPRFLQRDAVRADDDFEFRLRAADGRVVWLHNVVSSTAGEDGKIALGGFLFDVTDRKETEATLAEKLAIIQDQQAAIQQLSTPIIEVWEGVLTVPVFGSIDTRRAEQMMDILLNAVVRTSCRSVIIDLTGVDKVDASTADHLIKLIRSVQLVGSKGILVGIRPEVARTVVSIGVDLSSFITLGNLREGLLFCMRDHGLAVGWTPSASSAGQRSNRG